MLDLPEAILHILALFTPVFSKPVYKNLLLLFVGHILTKGRRTIADILRTLNLHHTKNLSKFHWILSGTKWNGLKVVKSILNQIDWF